MRQRFYAGALGSLLVVHYLLVLSGKQKRYAYSFRASEKGTSALTAENEPTWFSHQIVALQKQSKYVKVVHWEGDERMNQFMQNFFKNSQHCQALDVYEQQRPLLLNVTFGCQSLFSESGFGTGNFLTGLYGLRATTYAYKVDLLVSCWDAHLEQNRLVLPHVTGFFPWQQQRQVDQDDQKSDSELLMKHDVCQNANRAPIGALLEEIRYDMRRLAIAAVGSDKEVGREPKSDAILYQIPPRTAPIYPSVELDDAVIHFRCGDLMNNKHPGFGFLKFDDYVRHIPNDTESIGIVTQSLVDPTHRNSSGSSTEDMQNTARSIDTGSIKVQRCRVIVHALADCLRQRVLPGGGNPRVTIHSEDSILLAYTRLIMARYHTVVGISTFGIFACLATRQGVCHAFQPHPQHALRKRPNQWLLNMHRQTQKLNDPRIDLFTANETMPVATIRKLWLQSDGEKQILNWFRD